jgi:hypothetical protein
VGKLHIRPLLCRLVERPTAQRASGRRDSNPRPPAPKAGALTRLRYSPSFPGLTWGLLSGPKKSLSTAQGAHPCSEVLELEDRAQPR